MKYKKLEIILAILAFFTYYIVKSGDTFFNWIFQKLRRYKRITRQQKIQLTQFLFSLIKKLGKPTQKTLNMPLVQQNKDKKQKGCFEKLTDLLRFQSKKDQRNSLKTMDSDQENNQQNIQLNDAIKYQFYKKQQKQIDGSFHLRFPEIMNSPINQRWYKQLIFAVQFQTVKIWKTFWHGSGKVLQKQKQVKLPSDKDEIKVTWLGHASVCISIAGKVNILLDPIFQNRIVKFVGEKRLIQPACRVQQLPTIDLVLISHDHYDHCNIQSLKNIKNKFQKVEFVFGKNSKNLLPEDYDCQQLSWTYSKTYFKHGQQVKITFVPACHWSKRSLNDQNHRLWGGFVVEARGKKIYFAGDTGMCGLFKQLQQVFGSFDLCLLPIGAYQPNEKLHAQHINPKQAVQIHDILKSKLSIGIHWGTFPMSHQSPEQVLQDFKKAVKNKQQGQFIVVNIGGGVSIPLPTSNKRQYSNENKIFGFIK